VGNPRRNARKRIPPAIRRRALELLAGSRDGCSEAIMIAHGFSVEQITEAASGAASLEGHPSLHERIAEPSAQPCACAACRPS
jgi:hypothetical protein